MAFIGKPDAAGQSPQWDGTKWITTTISSSGGSSGSVNLTLATSSLLISDDAFTKIHWTFNTTSGNFYNNDVVGGVVASLTGANLIPHTYPGIWDNSTALYITGTVQGIIGGNGVDVGTSQMTAQAWVKPFTYGTTYQIIAGKSIGPTWVSPYGTWTMYLNSSLDGQAYFEIGTNNTAITNFNGGVNSIQRDQWNHVALTYDGVFAKGYVNGVEIARQAKTGLLNVDAGGPYMVGNHILSPGTNQLSGAIDDIKVESVARSADYIKNAYELGKFKYYLSGSQFLTTATSTTAVAVATATGIGPRITKVFDNIQANGVFPTTPVTNWTGSYSSRGDIAQISVNASGYDSATGLTTLYLKIDGAVVASSSLYFNENEHHAFPQIVHTTVMSSGSHALRLEITGAGGGGVADSNDFANLTIIEFSGSASGTGDWSTSAGKMKTSDSLSVDGQNRYVDAIGSDVFFYVSGTTSLTGSAAKKSVFGGDVVFSGSISILGSTWQDVYDLDFTQEPNQTFSADGSVTIAGKTWTVASKANSRTLDILNGTGMRIYTNANVSDYQNASANSAPRLSIPLSSVVPAGVTFPTFGIRVWTYFSSSNIDQNFERAFVGLEKQGATTDYRLLQVIYNNGAALGVSAPIVIINNNNAAVPPHATDVGTLTYGNSSHNVMLLQATAGALNFRFGVFPSGSQWPAVTALNAVDLLYQTLTSINFASGSGLQLVFGSYDTVGSLGNLTFDVKRVRIQIKEF